MKNRFTEQQNSYTLEQTASETPRAEITRGMGVSEPILYRWEKVQAGLDSQEIGRIKQTEEENSKRKHIGAGLMLDKQMIQDVLLK